jgi:hypothetical protein
VGSKNFGNLLDPMGLLVSKIAGPNSSIARFADRDGVGESPAMKQLGQQYLANNGPQNGQAGPTAGQSPSLAEALTGYSPGSTPVVGSQGTAMQPAPVARMAAPAATGQNTTMNPQAYVQAAGRAQQGASGQWGY